ncbi:MAG: formate/nitrite transporter family protein [Planctomycetota bacterium]
MTEPPDPMAAFDALLPRAMAQRAEDVGVRKAGLGVLETFTLAVLAGAFIGLGGVFSTTVVAGTADALPYGVQRLLAGSSFSLGLILVLVGGAELFTGNAMMVMAWASRRIRLRALLRNWGIVFLGNAVGAVATAWMVFQSGQHHFGHGAVGRAALKIAASKQDHEFVAAFVLGVLCNALVCLAVWSSFSARSTIDRIAAVVLPVTAFVAAGFEHSIANLYFVPLGLMLRADPGCAELVASSGLGESLARLTIGDFLLANLLPVTFGNLIGGAVLVASTYWVIYLRPRRDH